MTLNLAEREFPDQALSVKCACMETVAAVHEIGSQNYQFES